MTLFLGRWQDHPLPNYDHVITDPPYGERCHAGQKWKTDGSPSSERYRRMTRSRDSISTQGLGYEHLTEDDVLELVARTAPKCGGWWCAMTSHDLVPVYERALGDAGRYVFAPIACVQPGQNVRLAGDGPSNWTVWMVVSRRREADAAKWGALPGAYVVSPERGAAGVAGAKPLDLMCAIVRDYSRVGDVILEPYAGSGTTLVAAEMLGRSAIGYEVRPEAYRIAQARLESPVQRVML